MEESHDALVKPAGVPVWLTLSAKFLQQCGLSALTGYATRTMFDSYDPVTSFMIGLLVVMTVAGFVSAGFIAVYDRAQRDIFLIEELKELKNEPFRLAEAPWLVRKFARWSPVAKFFAVTSISDAFMTMIMLRKSARGYDGLTSREWLIFVLAVFSSSIVSISVWLIAWTILEMLWNGGNYAATYFVLPAFDVLDAMRHDPFLPFRR